MPPGQLRGRQWRPTAMQAPGEPEQYLAPTFRTPARIAVLGVGALGDEAVAFALTHQPAHTGRPADSSDKAHRVIVLSGLAR
jgi:hypothetical protein